MKKISILEFYLKEENFFGNHRFSIKLEIYDEGDSFILDLEAIKNVAFNTYGLDCKAYELLKNSGVCPQEVVRILQRDY